MSCRTGQDPELTVDEVVSTLQHSNLSNVLVEGPDDVSWYGILFEKGGITWEPIQAGGRSTLLKVFETLSADDKKSVIFVADQDLWCFSGIPKEYDDIVFTTGYSIENDAMSDSAGYALLDPKELQLIDKYKAVLGEWFAFCVDSKLKGDSPEMDVYPGEIAFCENGCVKWNEKYRKDIGFSAPDVRLVQKINNEFELLFRGKCLTSLYAHVISRRKTKGMKYSDVQLMDVSLRSRDLDGLRKDLVDRIKTKIAERS